MEKSSNNYFFVSERLFKSTSIIITLDKKVLKFYDRSLWIDNYFSKLCIKIGCFYINVFYKFLY
jgi:hypothetical protein